MAFKGIDIRQTTDRLVFRAFFQNSSGAIVTSGSATLKLYELQSDGTLKSYDFNDNTFKTGALTTETLSMTHRQGNNNTTNTGIWTAVLTTLTGFTKGNIYFAQHTHSSAAPTDQTREFQFGSIEGDGDDGIVGKVASVTSASVFTGDNSLSSSDDAYKGSVLYFTSGTQRGIARKISSYTGSSRTFNFSGGATAADAAFPAAPSTGDTFVILGRIA